MLLAVVLVLGISPLPVLAKQDSGTPDPVNSQTGQNPPELPELPFPLTETKAQTEEGNEDEVLFSSTCGKNLTWEWYKSGLLKISGTGQMSNYAPSYSIPWNTFGTNDSIHRSLSKKASPASAGMRSPVSRI